MVTECPLSTAWVLAASFPVAVLVVTTCLTVCACVFNAVSQGGAGAGVMVSEGAVPRGEGSLGNSGSGRVIPSDWSAFPFSFGPGKSLVTFSLSPPSGESIALQVSSRVRALLEGSSHHAVFSLPRAAFSGGVRPSKGGACSLAPSSHHVVDAVMMGVTMVGDFSFDAFTRDELLAECLAGWAVLGSASCRCL